MLRLSLSGPLGLLCCCVVLTWGLACCAAPQLQLLLPLGRTVYQDNERIDVTVVRSDTAALPAGDLIVTLTGTHGGSMVATFPVKAVALEGADARASEHLYINGRLLRPGTYSMVVAANGANATTTIEVYSHLRKSSFVTLEWWSRAEGEQFEVMGEEGMGFNMSFGHFRNGATMNVEGTIRAGIDHMQLCTMSGAHQMDLRMECDWSDPYVLGGGAARGSQQAFISRIAPNSKGVHFYDEPGLTWEGPTNQFGVTAQHLTYERAFGTPPFPIEKVNPADPVAREQWAAWQRWRMSFMDAAWKQSGFSVTHVRADFLPVTQSVYGWYAYADGYYFNVVRSLPIISGHGGYSDAPSGFLYPTYTMEMGRMRDMNKPYWYLPSWYRMGSEQYRLEQYGSFMQNLQGIAKPPDAQIHVNPAGVPEAQGIVEANKLFLRLGTIFTTMPVTRPPVAVLYSMSQVLDGEQHSIVKKDYVDAGYNAGGHRNAQLMAYVASKMIQAPMLPVVDEDVLDGTLAKNHRVLLMPGVNYLDANMLNALHDFILGGGVVLVDNDAKVQLPGIKRVGAKLNTEYLDTLKFGTDEYWSDATYEKMMAAVAPFASALAARLKESGISPIIDTSSRSLLAARQAYGDIEYIFTANATNTPGGTMSQLAPLTATIGLIDDGRPIYDAVYGGETTAFKKDGLLLKGNYRFGPGQMRVFARTTRPIGSVQAMPVTQQSDFALEAKPLSFTISALLMDVNNRVLSGSAPMEIIVTDPLGVARTFFRATDRGMVTMELPLAANDPAGEWSVSVRELLSNKEDTVRFSYAPVATCGAVAGLAHRAVFFADDRQNIFRFFRLNKDLTIVTGAGDYTAAAERLTKVLAPWGVRCKTVPAAAVNKARTVLDEAKRTWVGLAAGRPNFNEPNIGYQGFAVDGPVLLVGTPEDNPLIKFALDNGFLPYRPSKDAFPGRGRGYLAWQTDAVGYFNQESVTLIAYDQAGMDEAIGTLYEMCAGLDPLMSYVPPQTTRIMPANVTPPALPSTRVLWQAQATDRVLGMRAGQNGILTVIANDGSTLLISPQGIVQQDRIYAMEEALALTREMNPAQVADIAQRVKARGFIAKRTVEINNLTAIAYWGGLLQVVDAAGAVRVKQMMPQDITALAVQNGKLVVGLADGRVMCMEW